MKVLNKLFSLITGGLVLFFSGINLISCADYVVAYYMGPVYDMNVSGSVIDADTKKELTNIRAELIKDDIIMGQWDTVNDNNFGIQVLHANEGKYILKISDSTKDSPYEGQSFELTKDTNIFRTNIDVLLNKKAVK